MQSLKDCGLQIPNKQNTFSVDLSLAFCTECKTLCAVKTNESHRGLCLLCWSLIVSQDDLTLTFDYFEWWSYLSGFTLTQMPSALLCPQLFIKCVCIAHTAGMFGFQPSSVLSPSPALCRSSLPAFYRSKKEKSVLHPQIEIAFI